VAATSPEKQVDRLAAVMAFGHPVEACLDPAEQHHPRLPDQIRDQRRPVGSGAGIPHDRRRGVDSAGCTG
jgi:hypothetical protein